jgi:NAD+ synthase
MTHEGLRGDTGKHAVSGRGDRERRAENESGVGFRARRERQPPAKRQAARDGVHGLDEQVFKVVLPGDRLTSDRLNVSQLVLQTPEGEMRTVRLSPDVYREIVAATNFKQRTRKMMEYYHADRLNFAVAGTPNRLEYDQGFFVKNGDGAADIKPIAHLYKTQVYQLAEYLRIPDVIRSRPPTTDTYSLPQTQEEFYFSLPYDQLDLCLYARNHDVPAADVGAVLGLTERQVERVFRDIDSKRRATPYLHMPPQMVADPLEAIR